jgi:hypothetical protein
MTDRIPHAEFPSDETLAAFIDGRLDPELRRRVVEHIATCAECYDVVLGANELGAAQAPGTVVPFRRRRTALVGIAAAAVFALLLFGPLRERFLPGQRSGLAALAEAAPPERNIEGRLSGFPYRPLKPVTRGEPGEDTSPEHIKLLAVATQVAADAEKNPTVENLHAQGVSLLMLGNERGAIDALERALRTATGESDRLAAIRKSTDASLTGDLASAYLARAAKENGAEDVLAANEAADRAYRLAPSPETAWNRALALERLHLDSQAIQAWSDYLKLDSTSPWADEARRHTRAPQPNSWREWPARKQQLDRFAAAGDEPASLDFSVGKDAITALQTTQANDAAQGRRSWQAYEILAARSLSRT